MVAFEAPFPLRDDHYLGIYVQHVSQEICRGLDLAVEHNEVIFVVSFVSSCREAFCLYLLCRGTDV